MDIEELEEMQERAEELLSLLDEISSKLASINGKEHSLTVRSQDGNKVIPSCTYFDVFETHDGRAMLNVSNGKQDATVGEYPNIAEARWELDAMYEALKNNQVFYEMKPSPNK